MKLWCTVDAMFFEVDLTAERGRPKVSWPTGALCPTEGSEDGAHGVTHGSDWMMQVLLHNNEKTM